NKKSLKKILPVTMCAVRAAAAQHSGFVMICVLPIAHQRIMERDSLLHVIYTATLYTNISSVMTRTTTTHINTRTTTTHINRRTTRTTTHTNTRTTTTTHTNTRTTTTTTHKHKNNNTHQGNLTPQ